MCRELCLPWFMLGKNKSINDGWVAVLLTPFWFLQAFCAGQSSTNDAFLAGWVPHHLRNSAPWNPTRGEDQSSCWTVQLKAYRKYVFVDTLNVGPFFLREEISSCAGGGLCHSAEGRLWSMERRPHAADDSAGWGFGSFLCSVHSVTQRCR